MKQEKKPGFNKNTPLDVRMKEYEATTDYSLIPQIPVYVRLDGRAFHTFCHGLEKPFDADFTNTMKRVTAYLHEKTNALVSYCQSDEISLVYAMPEKMPFGTRLFKVQSVLAGMCSAAFIRFGIDKTSDKFKNRVLQMIPHFDARVCQMPLTECANMMLWRENDSFKNAVTLVALSKFSDKQIHKKNTQDKISMLKDVGIDFYSDIAEDLRNGSYFHRITYEKKLEEADIARIPEKSRPIPADDGNYYVTRSKIEQFSLGKRLVDMTHIERMKTLFNASV